MEEEGKDDWHLDEPEEAPTFNSSEEELYNHSAPEDRENTLGSTPGNDAPSGSKELYLALLGLILAPLLILALFLSWKTIEKNREEGKRNPIKLHLALLVSLLGIGLYLLLIALLLLSGSGLI